MSGRKHKAKAKDDKIKKSVQEADTIGSTKKCEYVSSVKKPLHSQEEIQNYIVEIWKNGFGVDQDKLRAEYASTYSASEGGWCDGWSYVLSTCDEDIAAIWEEIDNIIGGKETLSLSKQFIACSLARRAFLYHVTNDSPPTAGSQQRTDYDSAGFDIEKKPADRETWQHDEKSTLAIAIIKQEIKSMKIDQTLRLTSPRHDAAVKRVKDGYIVSETENYGVQKCDTLDDVMFIIDEWKKECNKNDDPFFNQTMIV